MTFRSSLSTDTQYSRRCSLRRALSVAAGGASETDADGLRYGNAIAEGLSSLETGDAHRRPSAANPAPPAALCLRHRLRHARLSSRPGPRAYCAPYGSTQDPFAPALRPVVATRTATHLTRAQPHPRPCASSSPAPRLRIAVYRVMHVPIWLPSTETIVVGASTEAAALASPARSCESCLGLLVVLGGEDRVRGALSRAPGAEGSLPAVDRSLPPSASATGASPFLGPPRDAPRPFASPEGS
ncbi:hypothetical protein DFH06DRAFT_1319313 [Mycena polygramma]|nr:hypothetical protein DFH06DRAFT_1319313 [Mycena polygramma]